MSYSAWRRRQISKHAEDVFYTLAHFNLEERLAFVCVQSTLTTHLFHSLMLHFVERYSSGYPLYFGIQTTTTIPAVPSDTIDTYNVLYIVH